MTKNLQIEGNKEVTIDVLLDAVDSFRQRLSQVRNQVQPEDGWYQYDSMSNIWILSQFLSNDNRSISRLAAQKSIADFGAADGDTAFLLSSFGFKVDIVDYAETNHNGLEGARLLKTHLGLDVGIHDVNLDRGFWAPDSEYGLVLFLGILYHLQNPFAAMANLAEISDHCIVSTRITRLAQDQQRDISDIPAAYLVDEFEMNNDPTNYWIFTEAGLLRLFDRTGWRVKDTLKLGDLVASDPISMDHDERFFALLESKKRDIQTSSALSS
jgi:tRNA (mo5U34)-methyltransferase